MPPDRVSLPALSELPVVRDEYGAVLVCIDRLLIIRRIRSACLRRCPGAVAGSLKRSPTPCINVVVEVEAHLRADRPPSRLEIVGGQVRERLKDVGV